MKGILLKYIYHLFLRYNHIYRELLNYNDPEIIAEVSANIGEPMVGINIDTLDDEEKLADRGWQKTNLQCRMYNKQLKKLKIIL